MYQRSRVTRRVRAALICALFSLQCAQGLANESSNHSYGSLGSSSDKESEVKHTEPVLCTAIGFLFRVEGGRAILCRFSNAWRDAAPCFFFFSLPLPTRRSASPTTSTSSPFF